MKRFCLLVTFALLSHEAFCRVVKRQAEDDSSDEKLDDRYGWNRPGRFPNQGQLQRPGLVNPQFPNMGDWSFPEPLYPSRFPWQFPGQGQFPGQIPNQNQQFPGQGQFPGQNQGQFPGVFPGQNQGQFPGQFPGQNQGQFPGQNQGQFPGQNQGQFPGQNQGQFPGQNQGQFPGQNQGQFPGQNQGQVPDPNAQTTPAPSGTTTQSLVLQDCLRTCPVTSEYNPVCGTDNVTYDNPGRLLCAQACGVSVNQLRASRCPAAPAA